MTAFQSPFHTGEIAAQRKAGVARETATAGRFIRDHMPDQHRSFFADLPFMVVAGADRTGRRWASILEIGEEVIASPDPRILCLPGGLPSDDPLAEGVVPGAEVGLLGIELATRRRNRVNGRLRGGDGGLLLEVAQSFGNCPQYIRQKEVLRTARAEVPPAAARVADRLSRSQVRWIRDADTLFIGTGADQGPNRGFDASHRGGAPGFVDVDRPDRLRIPDYAGNNYFNTIGNLLCDPRVGLLFVDFETGGLLHLTGRAEIRWNGENSSDPQARREVIVVIEKVVERPAALTLRWRRAARARRLRITDKRRESVGITSFHLVPADGGSLLPFVPGQHLPVSLTVPGHPHPIERNYSLSGPVCDTTYRITVKREAMGIASRFLHDHLTAGDVIEARAPSGDFRLPGGDTPLVLASAGVGVTPMLAMLHAVAAARSPRRVWFFHGIRNGAEHVFREEARALARRAEAISLHTFYSAPLPEDLPLPQGALRGRMTAADLVAPKPGPDADYLLCGPVPFMAELAQGLAAYGVAADRIHWEDFGSAS